MKSSSRSVFYGDGQLLVPSNNQITSIDPIWKVKHEYGTAHPVSGEGRRSSRLGYYAELFEPDASAKRLGPFPAA